MSNPLEATQVQSSDGSGGRIPDFLERNISIARVFLDTFQWKQGKMQKNLEKLFESSLSKAEQCPLSEDVEVSWNHLYK